MDTVELIGTTLGLGFIAGIRLYATVLALGLAIRFHWLNLVPVAEPLAILAHPAVLIAAGLAYAAEFLADKIPWVDSFWDSFHTFIRPIGAAILAASVLGDIDPVLKLAMIILCGGVALASHSSKVATRLVVNHSPEPFSNIAVSLAEDALVPVSLWVSLGHPLVSLSLVAVFLAAFIWVMPGVFRSMRLKLVALRAGLGRRRIGNAEGALDEHVARISSGFPLVFNLFSRHALPIPVSHAYTADPVTGKRTSHLGIRAGATKSVKGFRNSIGYLVVDGDHLVFVARRHFRRCIHRIRIDDMNGAEVKWGLLMNRLILQCSDGDKAFYLFKNIDTRQLVPERQPLSSKEPKRAERAKSEAAKATS